MNLLSELSLSAVTLNILFKIILPVFFYDCKYIRVVASYFLDHSADYCMLYRAVSFDLVINLQKHVYFPGRKGIWVVMVGILLFMLQESNYEDTFLLYL